MSVVAVMLALLVAAVNGGNDIANGLATHAGSGATNYRTAIRWGALTTLVGGVAAVWWGAAMGKNVLHRRAGGYPQLALAPAMPAGTAGWVGLATAARLPMSTAHTLIGVGLLAAPQAVHRPVPAGKVAVAAAVALRLKG
jgi:PiT family inorganic phosphate transporter